MWVHHVHQRSFIIIKPNKTIKWELNISSLEIGWMQTFILMETLGQIIKIRPIWYLHVKYTYIISLAQVNIKFMKKLFYTILYLC